MPTSKTAVILAHCMSHNISYKEVADSCEPENFKGLPNNILDSGRDLSITDREEDIHIRPLVAKYEKAFIHYVKSFGADVIKKVLNYGQCGRLKLTFMHNKKDRRQMIKLLGL